MATNITEKGLKNSVPIEQLVTARVTLSSGAVLEVTNPVARIVELFQFVENPKNRFLNIAGTMVNINQITNMQWIDRPSTIEKK